MVYNRGMRRKYKDSEKLEAREAYLTGLSYKKVSNKLDIPATNIRRWCIDITRPPYGYTWTAPPRTKEHRKRLSLSKMGSKNPNWGGDKVGYSGLHQWVKRRKLKPGKCEKCKKVVEWLDLANISQKYKRDLNDWQWLCRKCHMKSDGRMELLKKHREKRLKKSLLFRLDPKLYQKKILGWK